MGSNVTPFSKMLSGVRSFQKNIDRNVITACKPHAGWIVKTNFYGQIQKGETILGTDIEPPYTFTTVRIKVEKHQITDHVTLYDEGNFYYGGKAIFKATQIDITSSDKKTKALEEKYGSEIFGLNEEHLSELSKMMLPDLQDAFRKQLLN